MPEPPYRDEEEYLLLLRRALRSKVLLLVTAVALTWGLWATLQAGNSTVPSIEDSCNLSLRDLKFKWGFPSDAPIDLFGRVFDDFAKYAEANKKDPETVKQFLADVDNERSSCHAQLAAAYVVKIRVPYLLEPVSIDGLALDDLWPFVMAAIASAVLILHFREHAVAVLLSWMALSNKSEKSASQLLKIRSNYRIGNLIEKTHNGRRFFIYKAPFVVQPESLLIYSLLALTLYSSLSLENARRIEFSHEMKSVLFDYISALYFFSVMVICIIWRVWRYYGDNLENLTGHRIFGGTRTIVAKPSRFLDGPYGNSAFAIDVRIVNKLANWAKPIPEWAADTFVPLAALATLFLGWIKPNYRGYEILSRTSTGELDVWTEFKYQLLAAIMFVLLFLLLPLFRRLVPEKNFQTVSKWSRLFGIGIELLIGNIYAHMIVLWILVKSESFNYFDSLSRPLIFTDPAIGFIAFVTCIFWLTARLDSRLSDRIGTAVQSESTGFRM